MSSERPGPEPFVYDIEVAGRPFSDVDEPTREYLLAKCRDDRARAALPDRMALYPGLGHVIAIGIWRPRSATGVLLLEGDTTPPEPLASVPGASIERGSERELLQRFWELCAPDHPRLVTYNGRGFDGPVLSIRSAQLGLPATRQLVPPREAVTEHCDLMDLLSFQGARREHFTLDYWCRRFEIPSPKAGISGAEVGRAYRAGRLTEIGEYCLRDAAATAELFTRLAPTLLPGG